MYRVKAWRPQDSKRKHWFVYEDSLAIYQAKNERDATAYMNLLLAHPKVG